MKNSETESKRLWHFFFEISDLLRDRAYLARSSENFEELSNLTVRQQKVIKEVHTLTQNNPEGVPLKDLAERLGLSAGTVSEAVETLVRKKSLEREICPSDRRSVRIRLSDSGRYIIQVGLNQINRDAEAMLSVLSPEEKRLFRSMLERLSNQLNHIAMEKEEK